MIINCKDNKIVRASLLALLLLLLSFYVIAASSLRYKLDEAVRLSKSAQTIDGRTLAAENVSKLVLQISGSDEKRWAMLKIAPMLDSPDDPVRYWAAIALGDLDVRSVSIISKLQKMLPAAECRNGVITSADGIRYALFKLNAKLPPRPSCARTAF